MATTTVGVLGLALIREIDDMKCIPTDQGTGNSDTALCKICFDKPDNKRYAREMASHTFDIDPNDGFVDCSGNEAVDCCICGVDIYGNTDREEG